MTEEQKEKIRGFAVTIIENEVTQQPIDPFLDEMNKAEPLHDRITQIHDRQRNIHFLTTHLCD